MLCRVRTKQEKWRHLTEQVHRTHEAAQGPATRKKWRSQKSKRQQEKQPGMIVAQEGRSTGLWVFSSPRALLMVRKFG
jgi:hypothetical protein